MRADLFPDIFRIICFSVFVGMVIRELYKKALPYVSDLYHKYIKMLADKVKLREKIGRHKEGLLREIQNQHAQGIELTEKVIVWATQEQNHTDQRMKREQQSLERLRNYMIEQSRFLALATARKDLMPEIMDQVVQEIQAKYVSSVDQKIYTAKILKALESDNHE